MAARSDKTIKVCLTNRGEDTETPWAHDLGPAGDSHPAKSRKVRLVNVPFLHAKPTWGDVIVVSPVEEGWPTWDRDGVPWKKIGTRIVEDGGRWAMIIDYRSTAGDTAFSELRKACEASDIVCEGAWGPSGEKPGRVYLAVPKALEAATVMERLLAAGLPCTLELVHPAPAKPAAPEEKAKPVVKAKPAAKEKAKPEVKAKPKKPPVKAKPKPKQKKKR